LLAIAAFAGSCLLCGVGSNSNTTAAITIVSPSADANVEGNSNNIIPFSLGSFGNAGISVTSIRYQQVYGTSDFGSSPLLITRLAFRPDVFPGGSTQFSTTLGNVGTFLMTTTKAPDDLSFAVAQQIAAALSGRHGLHMVHIIAHGAPGRVGFAAGHLDVDVLMAHPASAWRND
jgi:hypothetical protein